MLHIDFQRVDATTKVSKKVPLHFINEENSPAVKTDKCLVNHVVTDVQIQCLASQLPEFLTVDLGNLAKGQSLHVSDLKLADGIKVVTHGKKNPVIVSVSMPDGRGRGRCGPGGGRCARRSRQAQEEREAEQEVTDCTGGCTQPPVAAPAPVRRGFFVPARHG